MAYVEIEPSGCCERKGLLQIRFSMYLEPGDYRYERQYIQVPIIPQEELVVRISNRESNPKEFEKWINSLPKAGKNIAFHDHFIYVEPGTSIEEIMNIGEAFLHEAYIKWCLDERRDLNNLSLPFKFHSNYDDTHRGNCEKDILALKRKLPEKRKI